MESEDQNKMGQETIGYVVPRFQNNAYALYFVFFFLLSRYLVDHESLHEFLILNKVKTWSKSLPSHPLFVLTVKSNQHTYFYR